MFRRLPPREEDDRPPLTSPGPAAPAPPVLTTRPRNPPLVCTRSRPQLRGSAPEMSAISPTGSAGGGEESWGNSDSITLGQLKAHTAAMAPKPKPQLFDYRYDDSDTLMNELQEFYAYVETPTLYIHPAAFERACSFTWTATENGAKRREFVEKQLELIESPSAVMRRAAQLRIMYLLQGVFAETTSAEMQLHWVMQNARLIRELDGVVILVSSLRDASRRYHASQAAAESRAGGQSSRSTSVQESLTDSAEELRQSLGMLYFIVEVFRSDEAFGDELMVMSPSLPLVLFQMLSGLKDRPPYGYPFKKMLLLMWKTILACLGGINEVGKAHDLSRELAGLGPEKKNFTKATPVDIATFRRDISVKYPTFSPSPSFTTTIPNDKLAESVKPIPPRPNFHSRELPKPPKDPLPPAASTPAPPPPAPLPGTPAPTPPGSPAPRQKKQQFQTDPNRPFVFPFSHSSGAPASMVPYAIDEADKLYHKHAYISLSMYQLWEVREECIREERGLGRSGLIGFSDLSLEDEDTEGDEAMRREWRYEEEEMECKEKGDKEGAKAAREKKLASRRLHRVEVFYRSVLPLLQPCTIALLKILLANVTGPGMHQQTQPPPTSPTTEQPPPLPPYNPTADEIDDARTSEIVSKAISGILILLLKWFKASHVLKFHYFAQLLFDSNCMLLVLKMFGMGDLAQQVAYRHEIEDKNFFRYCQLNFSRSSKSAEEPIITPRVSPMTTGETDVEIITQYSWRNFFSAINFLKVLQKMTKHRSHRTFMMNQYKASAVFKRILKIQQPMMQLQTLKLIKSQMPWCGRRWRLNNMKLITAIYLNCRPDLRDEWLAGQDHESELEGALPQEYALRWLIHFYNKTRYPASIAALPPPLPNPSQDNKHHRSDSTSAVILEDPALHMDHDQARSRTYSGSSSERDVFPPRKSVQDGGLLPYNPDSAIDFWLHEYEDVLGEVFGDDVSGNTWDDEWGVGVAKIRDDNGEGARRLNEIFRAKGLEEDEISESESVVSIGELGEDARLGEEGLNGGSRKEENANTWEHMSSDTLSVLRSPQAMFERRRSSSSGASGGRDSPLRPVLVGGPLQGDPFDDDDDEPFRGPMPIERETADERERQFGAVDEVEYAYGE